MTKIVLKVTKGAPAWVVTFGDLMSLLLTFFVLLLSFSRVSVSQRYQEVNGTLKNAFGLAQTTAVSTPSAMDLIKINDDFTMTATKIEEELRKEVVPRFPLDEKKIEKPEVIRRKDRVILRFNGEAMFPSGKQEIDPRFHAFLDSVAARRSQQGEHDHRGAHRQRLVSNAPLFVKQRPQHRSGGSGCGLHHQRSAFERCACSRSVKALTSRFIATTPAKVATKNRRIEIQFVENMAEKGSLRLGTNKGVRFEVGGKEKTPP